MPILDFLKKKQEALDPGVTTPEGVSHGSPVQGVKGMPLIVVPFHIAPLVTEKSTALHALHQYSLQAPCATTKTHVRTMLKDIFHVHPVKIRMVPIAGRQVRYGRTQGATRRWKKYIVELPESEKLDMSPTKIP